MEGVGAGGPVLAEAAAEIKEKEKKEAEVKDKKKSKKKKKKKKRSRSSRSRSRGSKKAKRRKAKKETGGALAVAPVQQTATVEFKEIAQEVLFKGSGLDPHVKTRRKQRRRAQRQARRNHQKKEDSRSKSSDEGGELSLKGDQVFRESQKIPGIALQFPGVLSSQAIEQMQELLVQQLTKKIQSPRSEKD